MRPLLRLLAIFLGPALAVVALVTIGPELAYALAGHWLGWALTAACLVALFACTWAAAWGIAGRNPLGARRIEDRDRVPRRFVAVRIALAWIVLVSAYLLAHVRPPFRTAGDGATAALLALDIVLALVAYGTFDRPHPFGRWMVIAGGAWGLASLANGVRLLQDVRRPDPGPATVWSLVLAGSVLLMWVLAAVVVLSASRAWPPSPHATASHEPR